MRAHVSALMRRNRQLRAELGEAYGDRDALRAELKRVERRAKIAQDAREDLALQCASLRFEAEELEREARALRRNR